MKSKLMAFILLVIGFFNIQAITIKGEIPNYLNKEVFVYYYLNNSEILLEKTETDNKGNFSVDSHKDFNGLVKLFFPQSKVSAKLFVKNKPVQFKGNIQGGKLDFTSINDRENEMYYVYSNSPEYKKKRDALNYVEKAYAPSDTFYNEIENEKKRLNREYDIDFSNYPFLQYYVKMEEDYLLYEPKDQKDANRVAQEILEHLVNDNDYLEKSYLMTQLINTYLSYNITNFNTSEEQIKALRSAIDKALDATIVETSRGQNVLVSVINILRGFGLDYMADEYVEKANALTCTITDQLKSTINSTENTKVGATFQNFEFNTPQKGFKSLYDIHSQYKIVVFWGSFCPHCKDEKPLLEAYYPEFKEKGGEIVAFAIETNEQEFKNFIKGLNWINDSDYLFWSSPVVQKYGVEGTPTIYVLDKDNKIIAKGAKLDLVKDKIQ